MTNPQIERVSKAALHLEELSNRLQAEIDQVKTQTVSEAAVFYYGLKEAYDALDKARKLIYSQVEYMNKALLPEMMESQGVDKIQVPEIARSFYILNKSSCSMVDKERAFEWLRQREAGALITETVNAGTLSAYMTDMIKNEGIDPPEDLFKLSTYNTTGSSKYTPKG